MGNIAERNVYANSIISKELDDRARLLAAKLRMTRSRLIATALAEFVAKTESNPASVEVSHHGRK